MSILNSSEPSGSEPPVAGAAPAPLLGGLSTLLILAWPVVVARASQSVIGFTDAVMSSSLGEAPLAAVTTGSMNTFALTIFPMGVVFIVQSFASQLLGEGQAKAAVRYAWYGLILSGAFGLFAVASIPAVGPLLGSFGYEPAVHHAMTDYLEIRALAVGAMIGIETLGNWYGGLGNTRLHMVAGLVAMGVNVFLNWVLIFGNLGAPALGVEGAALASVIASWCGFAVLAVCFISGHSIPTASVRPRDLHLAELWRFIRFGMPHGLSWFFEFAAFTLFINVVVADLGTTVLAAMMVVFNINSVSFMPAFGLASAGAILIGQAIGSGELDRVIGIVKRTLGVALAWQGCVGLIYLLAPKQLMRFFAEGETNAELLAIGAVMLAISAAWQVFDSALMTFDEALRAAGDTAWVLWARIIVAWVVFLPTAYVSVHVLEGGYVAAISCMVGYLALLSAVLFARFRSGAWRRINLTGS